MRTSSATRESASPLSLSRLIDGHVIDQCRNPRTRKIAQSDDDRLKRGSSVCVLTRDPRRAGNGVRRLALVRDYVKGIIQIRARSRDGRNQ
jgi:hypothetical protein